MHSQVRDGALAIVGLVALSTLAVVTAGRAVLVDLRAIAVGVAGAVALEALFLRYPSVLLELWERPGVAVLALVALVGCGGVAVLVAPWLVGAGVWGLLVYLAVLGCVLAGVGNPVAVLARR
jgi:hypothetical protein